MSSLFRLLPVLLLGVSPAHAQGSETSPAETSPAETSPGDSNQADSSRPAPSGTTGEESGPPGASSPPHHTDEPNSADDEQYRTAEEYFGRGVRFFENQNFDAALTEFERAYQHLKGHPKRFFVLDNIGQCHERMFRYDRALEYYHRYLDEGGEAAEDRAVVLATINTLKGLLATLIIKSNVPAEVWVDDRQMGEAPGDVLVPGGLHVIELRAPGYESRKKEVNIAARETQTHDFTLDELSDYEGLNPIYFYGGAILGAGALAGGSYFGYRALSEDAQGKQRREDLGQFGNTTDDQDRVKRLALTADIFFAAGAVLGVGTTLLYFMTNWEGESQEQPPEARPAVDALLAPGSVGLNVRGHF